MKVYVETKPETIYSGRVKDEVKTTEIRMWFETDEEIEVTSLSDYTKQVRKEVVQEIKAEFDTSDSNHIDEKLYPPTQEAILIGKGFNSCKERLFKKLDRIQGETK